MKCQEVMELMQRHVDGDLDQQESSLMMDHIGRCPECAAMLDRLQRLSNELAQLPRVVPKFSLVDAIMPELLKIDEERQREANAGAAEAGEEEQAVRRSERPSRRAFRGWPGLVAMGVAAIAIVFTLQLNDIGGGTAKDHAMPDSSLSQAPQANESSAAGAAESSALRVEDVDTDVDVRATKEMAPVAGTDNLGDVPQDAPAASSGGDDSMARSSAVDQYGDGSNAAAPSDANAMVVTPSMNIIEEVLPHEGDLDQSITSFEAAEIDDAISKGYGLTAEQEQPAVLVSPDGKWRAVAVSGTGTIQVYDTDGDVLVFEAVREGSINHLTWDPSSKLLTYVWADLYGVEASLAYDAELKQEIKYEQKPETVETSETNE